MKKIGFVFVVNVEINDGSIFAMPFIWNHDDFKEYFSKDYDVSIDCMRDKDVIDYLIV